MVDAATGAVMQRIDYDVTGRVTADTSPAFQPFGYVGGLTDRDTGVVLFGARSYDPQTIRWISRDTAGFSGGRNHYAYADGDPVNRIDPSGLAGIDCFQDILGLVGMIPVAGTVVDVINAGIYAARGKWGDASIAAASSIFPFNFKYARGAARFGDDAAGSASRFASKTCNCFPAGTKVATARGATPIEKIAVGDRVYARDLATGKTRLRRVVGLFSKPANRLLDIRVAGTTVSVTPEHPVYVPGRGWVLAGDLRVGTTLLQRDGTVTAIEAIAHREEPTTVYNFEVEGDHNYYVSHAQLLVHNCAVPRGPATGADDLASAVSRGARTTSSWGHITDRLWQNHKISPELASERLHELKRANGLGGADNVVFDWTGNVFDPRNGELLGSLTQGGRGGSALG